MENVILLRVLQPWFTVNSKRLRKDQELLMARVFNSKEFGAETDGMFKDYLSSDKNPEWLTEQDIQRWLTLGWVEIV